MSPRNPPRLLQSGLTGKVYVATSWTADARGNVLARIKYDVTKDFEALETARAAGSRDVKPCAESCHGQSANWSTPDNVWRCCTCDRVVGSGNRP